MKILHILYSGLGGHGNVFFSMVNADENKEFEHVAIFNGIEKVRQEYLDNCSKNNIKNFYVPKKAGFDLTYYQQIYKLIKVNDPDIVFLHSSSYILPAKISGWFSKKKRKIVVRETHANNLKTKIDWLWLQVSILMADNVVFLSEEYKQEVLKKFKWIKNKEKFTVIPNGINLKLFYPSKKIADDDFVIGMQSRIVKIKDHLTLIKAFEILQEEQILFKKRLVLKIAGDGESLAGLKNYIDDNKIKDVHFLGSLSENELADFLRSLDVYVHASFGETMSTAIMQSMATSLPIVASNVPGINNMITSESTGLLVLVQNPLLLSAALKRLISDKNLSDKLSDAAYKFAVQNFSNITMFNRYKIIFKS